MAQRSLQVRSRSRVGVGIACLCTVAALAVRSSKAADDTGENLPGLSVSAQRLYGADLAASSGVVSADTIARSGATTIDEVLEQLPQFGFQGVNANQNAGGFGAAFVDLRNLNFNRTLVLIDGRRVVSSGIQTDEAVDLANIPVALIERVEVSADGSNPAYGADAVAGVVNIVLKRDLVGLSAAAGAGASDAGGGAAGDLAATYGYAFDRGNVTTSATWTQRDPVAQTDRAWARDPIQTATLGPDGRPVIIRGSPASLAGNALSEAGSSGLQTPGYDSSVASFLRGGLRRGTFNLMGHLDLSGSASAFTELSYGDRTSDTQLPPQTLGLSGTQRFPAGFVVPAANVFNPYGADVTLQRVLGEVGVLRTQTHNRLYRVVAGLEGTLEARTRWSVSINHGDSQTEYRTRNAVNLAHVLQSVSTDPAACPAGNGCVAADYFGAGSLSPAAVAYIAYTDVTRSRYTNNQLQGTLSRALDVLQDAPWLISVGAEYRTEHGETRPDPLVLAGDQAGGDSAATSGGYNTREVYDELKAPLLVGHFLVEELEIEANVRYTSTSLFGAFPVAKLAAFWTPVEGVRMHAGVATSRRVPAITEAFGGRTTTLLEVTDPCDSVSGQINNPVVIGNCRALGIGSMFRQSSPLIPVANGGNPGLKPERARNFNLGLAVGLPQFSAFTARIDYFDYVIHDAIDSLSDGDPNFIPSQCYASRALSSPYCRLIARAPSGPSTGQINRIDAPDQNIGAIRTDGVDVALHYQHEFARQSSLTMDWQNTFLLNYRVQEAPGAPFMQEAGTFPDLVSAGSLTRFKSLLTSVFDTNGWSFAWNIRFIGGARVLGQDPGTPFSTAQGIYYHDLSAAFHRQTMTFQLGVNNVADKAPPLLIDGISNTNLSTYDVIGRYAYARATYSFR